MSLHHFETSSSDLGISLIAWRFMRTWTYDKIYVSVTIIDIRKVANWSFQDKNWWHLSNSGLQELRFETLTTDDCPLKIRSIVGAGESLGIITVVS